uniref:Transglutaminase C-terminal domain-containing protein n=1 Tax=Stegastes partitus TaxID=144197 RepID=A0A3B4ZFH9_9TELE
MNTNIACLWFVCMMAFIDSPPAGVFRCGPASVKAVLEGHTDFKYDVPFVFAEVNADCIDWTVTDDGKKVRISSDTKRVGKFISTKRVGSRQREDITNTYKHPEGTDKERRNFVFATTRDYSRPEEMYEEIEEEDAGEVTTEEPGSGGTDEGATSEPLPPVTIRFKEVSRLINGKDVNLKLVLQSQSSDTRPLSIHISVQAMKYYGVPAGKILTEDKEETLLPGKVLSIPIVIPFSAYHRLMVENESMKVTAVITDKGDGENRYLATHDIVLMDPPISITAPAQVRLNALASGDVIFTNPINKTLTNCKMTFSGAGLFRRDIDCK